MGVAVLIGHKILGELIPHIIEPHSQTRLKVVFVSLNIHSEPRTYAFSQEQCGPVDI